NAGVVLYAPGYVDQYTDRDAFFMSANAAPTITPVQAQAHGLFNPGVVAQNVSGTTTSLEFRDVYFDWDLRPYDYPPYFSSQYLTQGSTQSFTLNCENVSTGAGSLMVNVWSLTGDDHAVNAFVNGTSVGQASWSGGGKFMAVKFQVPAGVFKSGANTIDLVTSANTQIALVHSLSADYTRNLVSGAKTEIVN